MLSLEKVTIIQLLKRYDIEIDMSDRCRVLIGANGIGKSASLKIIYNIIKRNFVDIISIPFERIEIVVVDETGEKVSKTLSYMDCLPSKEYIVENFDMLPNTALSLGNLFEKFIDVLEEKELYGAFIWCLYKKTEFPATLKKLINDHFNFGLEDNFLSLKEHNHIEELVSINREELYVNDIQCFWGSKVTDSSIYPVLEQISNNSFYFDLVQYYYIKNDIRYTSEFYSKEKEWAYSDKKVLEYHADLKREIDLRPLNTAFFEICKDNFSDVFNECKEELLDDRCLDINRLINITYFETDIISEINSIATKYAAKVYDLYDGLIEDSDNIDRVLDEDLIKDFTSRDIEVFTHFIRPVLVNKSLFDLDLENTILESIREQEAYSAIESWRKSMLDDGIEVIGMSSRDDETEKRKDLFEKIKLKVLLEFINEVTPIVTDDNNKSEIVKNYQKILQKYFIDRTVNICPSGLAISFRKYEDEDKSDIIYDLDNIDLSFLSSGEKKLILLFTVAMFFDETIFLDEPELSLSLVWQEQLLPDILQVSNNKIICATHSPYIVNDASVQKYINYIP